MTKEKGNFYEIKNSDIPLMELTNIFFGNLVWINRGIDKGIATYDLVVRELPKYWNFYVFDGLEKITNGILNYKFDEESISIMKTMNLIDSKKCEEFYRKFKFSGDVWSLENGEIFFPGEPIVRVTAPILEANTLTAFMLNSVGYPVRGLTKHLRVKLAVEGEKADASGGSSIVRLASPEQGMYMLRACKILNQIISAPVFYKKFPQYLSGKRKVIVSINHAMIKSFENEIEAFKFVFSEFENRVDLVLVMVDTYDFKKGLQNFINEIKNYPKIDKSKFMVTIDSGDIQKLAFFARKILDKNNLEKIKIQAFGNLDEYKIKKMVDAKTPVDFYLAGTEVSSVTDNPKFEAVYKMAEIIYENGKIEQKAKLTKGKQSYPGRKQIFRMFSKGKMVKDVIGLEDEKLGKPLLQKIISKGELIIKMPTLEEIGKKIEQGLAELPKKYKEIDKPAKYPVAISKKLENVLEVLKKKHIK